MQTFKVVCKDWTSLPSVSPSCCCGTFISSVLYHSGEAPAAAMAATCTKPSDLCAQAYIVKAGTTSIRHAAVVACGLRPSARPSIRIFEPGVVPSIIFACTQQHKYSLPKWLRDENKHKALTKHPCRTRQVLVFASCRCVDLGHSSFNGLGFIGFRV